jgi:competence protein ComEA
MHHHHHVRRFLTVLALSLALLSVSLVTPVGAMAQGAKPGKGAAPARPVDLNRAGAEELVTLPGIGKALAQRIIEFREKNGPFRRVEDLMKVKGIGEKSFQKIRPHVTIGEKH